MEDDFLLIGAAVYEESPVLEEDAVVVESNAQIGSRHVKSVWLEGLW